MEANPVRLRKSCLKTKTAQESNSVVGRYDPSVFRSTPSHDQTDRARSTGQHGGSGGTLRGFLLQAIEVRQR
jgi:hypothetical protein